MLSFIIMFCLGIYLTCIGHTIVTPEYWVITSLVITLCIIHALEIPK